MKRNRVRSIALTFVAFLLATPALPQTTRPTIQVDLPLAGQLLNSNGQSLKDAWVRLVARKLDIYDAKLYPEPIPQDGMSWAKTDAEGRFSFPSPLPKKFTMIVFTDSGYVLAKSKNLSNDSAVKLQLVPWGRLEGTLMLGDKPAPEGTTIDASDRDFMLEELGPYMQFRAKTDASGHFVFPRMPALEYVVYRVMGRPEEPSSTSSKAIVTVAPGGVTSLSMGSTYRPLAGRIELPKDYQKSEWFNDAAEIHAPVRLPSIELPGNLLDMTAAQRSSWWESFQHSAQGRQLAAQHDRQLKLRDVLPMISRDGNASFRIDDLAPGDYTAVVRFYPRKYDERGPHTDYDTTLVENLYPFDVPPMPYDNAPFKLGILPAKQDGLMNLGQPAPDIVIPVLDRKEILLSQFKGKVVLLDFWGVWCGACVHDLPHFQAIYDRFGKNPNFVMISLSVDDSPEKVREFLQKNRMPWTIGVLGDRKQAWQTQVYAVAGYPTYWLIGADGKVAANGNFSDFLSPLIEQALAKVPTP